MQNIPACVIREPAAVYHAKAKNFLSSHRLADFRKSPLLYHRKREGLIAESDSPAYLEGRAGHCLILEGRAAYAAAFVTDADAPVNPRTGKSYGPTSDKYREWVACQQAEVITAEMAARIEAMHASVKSHEIASRLLASGTAEGVIRAEYCGVPCQIRMDFLHPAEGLVDLKTCDDLTWFEHDAVRYGYPHQLAFYRAVFTAAVGEEPPVYLIAVEKKEPYRAGVWRMGEEVLAIARRENEQAVERLKHCRETGVWPSGYEELRVFDRL